MLRMSASPSLEAPGTADTEGQISRMRASPCCGGTRPVTAWLRTSVIEGIPVSSKRVWGYVRIDTQAARFDKGRPGIAFALADLWNSEAGMLEAAIMAQPDEEPG